MVCHETYKDQKGNWLSPDEIKIENKNVAVSIKDGSKVLVGTPEAMSKSKKILLTQKKWLLSTALMLFDYSYFQIVRQIEI